MMNKKKPKKKKVTLAKFSDDRRKSAIKTSKKNREPKKDNLTTHQRNIKKIKEVANGCWWIEAYLHDRCMVYKEK
tara:strand:- start:5774 stop:5998 length:225 start_codon:yes stop_codon:yes gene_type:complete